MYAVLACPVDDLAGHVASLTPSNVDFAKLAFGKPDKRFASSARTSIASRGDTYVLLRCFGNTFGLNPFQVLVRPRFDTREAAKTSGLQVLSVRRLQPA